ncbi:MAG: hypothetical protein HY369_05060 [Candidatus Aenigmarchaeota archaeon]|nr:hypothetical protein [Candidatus Aenigmarchaeota archaeon]
MHRLRVFLSSLRAFFSRAHRGFRLAICTSMGALILTWAWLFDVVAREDLLDFVLGLAFFLTVSYIATSPAVMRRTGGE